jgi:hypothetical protein
MFYYPAGAAGKQGIEIPVRIIVLVQIFRGFGLSQFKKIPGASVAGNPFQISRTEQDVAADATRSVLFCAYGTKTHKIFLPLCMVLGKCLDFLSAAFRIRLYKMLMMITPGACQPWKLPEPVEQ